MGNRLVEAADEILRVVSDALSADLRPVCKVYQTHGIPVIFQCCECEDPELGDEANGEISIHFRRLMDANASTLDEIRRVRPCKGGVTVAQFRLVLARCRPVINEHGEVPPPETLTEHTEDQLRDAEILWAALACSGMEIRIDDLSADLSDPGTCSVMFVDLSVPVTIPALPVDQSA